MSTGTCDPGTQFPGTQSCSKQLGFARSCSEQLGVARSCSELLNGLRYDTTSTCSSSAVAAIGMAEIQNLLYINISNRRGCTFVII